jgi:hypothetical protein
VPTADRSLVSGHIYVDESTENDYLLMCAVFASADVNQARTAMRNLLLPGQRDLHMKKERRRAAQILGVIVELNPEVIIYRVDRKTDAMVARRRCVEAVAGEACRLEIARLVMDPIESVVDRDLFWILQGVRKAGHATPPFGYHHMKRHEEPLLWIADSVGWAWARGGAQRKLVEQLVTVIDL